MPSRARCRAPLVLQRWSRGLATAVPGRGPVALCPSARPAAPDPTRLLAVPPACCAPPAQTLPQLAHQAAPRARPALPAPTPPLEQLAVPLVQWAGMAAPAHPAARLAQLESLHRERAAPRSQPARFARRALLAPSQTLAQPAPGAAMPARLAPTRLPALRAAPRAPPAFRPCCPAACQ